MNARLKIPLPLRAARKLGLARGLVRSTALGPRPTELLELYSIETCGSCRRVRQVLTELDLDFVHRSCPKGDSANRRRLLERGVKLSFPFLVDPNRGVELHEADEIIAHLHASYGVGQ